MWLLFHMVALKSQELFRGHPFMTSTQKGGGGWGGGGGLEISRILIPLNNKPIACFCRWGEWDTFPFFVCVKYSATFVVTLLKSFPK